MLALAMLRWLRRTHTDDDVEVLAFFGGEMLGDFSKVADVDVMLDDHEAWDHEAPPPGRVAELRHHTADLSPASANLLVSVAAGQCLPLLDLPGPIVTWSVEVAEDLHWLSGPIGLAHLTDRWIAGSNATAEELADRLGRRLRRWCPSSSTNGGVSSGRTVELRRELGSADGQVVVVGVGIGAVRKGLDLFVEAAAEYERRWPGQAVFSWFGGQTDPLWPMVSAEIERLALPVTLRPAIADLTPHLTGRRRLLASTATGTPSRWCACTRRWPARLWWHSRAAAESARWPHRSARWLPRPRLCGRDGAPTGDD